jgi:hypothetical protein
MACLAFSKRDPDGMSQSVEHLRRAYPHLTVPLVLYQSPAAGPDWLEAMADAGMPL